VNDNAKFRIENVNMTSKQSLQYAFKSKFMPYLEI